MTPLLYSKPLRYFTFIFFIAFHLNLPAQQFIALPDTVLPNTHGCERDPVRLVNRLTAGKESDKEKFDAIFTWVAKNIRYDYYAYLAPRGASKPDVHRILKHKAGICLDYAFLMDSLCRLAGIRNVSVYGYAKDDLFDVRDSIFMDNHAWNAVKLDNYWYVYDVTWSSGVYKWKYKRFSQFIVNWRNKLESRVKKKAVVFKTKWRTECDTVSTSFSQEYIDLPLKNKILLRLLSMFKLKKRLVLSPVQPYFYLTDPEVFAITHFPDNPYWSLTGKYNTVRDFENDSAYYHLTDSIYIKQKRISSFCLECDNYFSLSEMARQKQMKSNSLSFNSRNHFVPWLCDYTIGDLLYDQSLPVTDSAAKIPLIDSALAYMASAKDELHNSALGVTKDNELQRTKNTRKSQLLVEENREHITFMHGLLATTRKESGKMQQFIQKTRATEKSLRACKRTLVKIADDSRNKPAKFRERENVLALQSRYIGDLQRLDSANREIALLQSAYSTMATKLSDNLWQKTRLQDSLTFPFILGDVYRFLFLLDNYKKPIVEKRKEIPKFRNLYAANLRDSVYALSDSCADLGLRVFTLFRKRNNLIIESEQLLNVLVNEKMAAPDSFAHFMEIYTGLQQENICWLIGGSSKTKSVISGYKMLVKKQEYLLRRIRAENRSEYSRYREINHEVIWRKMKFRSVPAHNLRVCSARKNFILHYKRDYLKSLKEERKKSRQKKNRKVNE